MKDIFKIQRSLASTDGVRTVLVYNESRTMEYQGELFPEIDELFPDGVYKIFVRGDLMHGDITIDSLMMEDPGW